MGKTDSLPVIIAPIKPFRLVIRDESDGWNCDWDQANDRGYDYVKLSRITVFLDVGLEPPALLAVGYDGTFIIPAMPDFLERTSATEIFNNVLGKVLLGGIFVEAVSPVDVGRGLLFPTGYFTGDRSTSRESNLHAAMRGKFLGTLDLPMLVHPAILTRSHLYRAYTKGDAVFRKVQSMSLPIFLRSITDLINHEWSESLLGLWTCIEQLVSQIWELKILGNISPDETPGRRAFLLDHRSWPVANRIELLFEKKLVNASLYKNLTVARKARNDFIHRAVRPSKRQAETAVKAVYQLIYRITSEFKRHGSLSRLAGLHTSHDNLVTDIWREERPNGKPDAWLRIPPIPGDPGWGGAPYETFDDIKFEIPVIPEDKSIS